ncbi:MAG: ribonuclease HII [Nanoarchaeota archaeon]
MTLVCGSDEAGRGPTVGSMFIVGSMFNEEDISKLKELGVKDSKLLTHKKRKELAKEIEKLAVEIKVIQVKPNEIDEAVSDDNGFNLNWLEAKKHAEIINQLKPHKMIIDCPSPNIKAYTNYLRKLLDPELLNTLQLIIEHKAEKHMPVAAASIIAKCKREEEVLEIEKIVGQSIGSGYSSNPVCQKFLKENFDKYPEFIRKSWSTFKVLDEQKKQKSLKEF